MFIVFFSTSRPRTKSYTHTHISPYDGHSEKDCDFRSNSDVSSKWPRSACLLFIIGIRAVRHCIIILSLLLSDKITHARASALLYYLDVICTCAHFISSKPYYTRVRLQLVYRRVTYTRACAAVRRRTRKLSPSPLTVFVDRRRRQDRARV